MSKARILIAEDEDVARDNLAYVLAKAGHSIVAVPDGESAVKVLRQGGFDLVLTDLRMKGLDGLALLETTKALSPDTEVVILTGYATVDIAVGAMAKGAYHFLAKPYNLDELRALVAGALEKRRLRLEVAELRRQLDQGAAPRLVGHSRAMLAVRETIGRIAPVDSTVLILGETGTGKELAARQIHDLSPRSGKPFLAVNCAAFSEELLANEFFGHEREAFTGARGARRGIMEAVQGGTLFLDEVGDMSQSLQVKLLRVLQERQIIRVGGTQPIPVDFRLIAATNKDLGQEAAAGSFRQDLYFRLKVIILRMPPLAERREDIPLLVSHFLAKHGQALGKRLDAASPSVLELLDGYAFPGNVRELENIVESAAVMANGSVIEVGHLPPDLQHLHVQLDRHDADDPGLTLAANERRHIERVLRQAGGNRTLAARLLGIDRATLWRKLKFYALDGGEPG